MFVMVYCGVLEQDFGVMIVDTMFMKDVGKKPQKHVQNSKLPIICKKTQLRIIFRDLEPKNPDPKLILSDLGLTMTIAKLFIKDTSTNRYNIIFHEKKEKI